MTIGPSPEALALLAGIQALAAAAPAPSADAAFPATTSRRDLPRLPPGRKWVRRKVYNVPSLADQLRVCTTSDQVREFVNELIRKSPGSSGTRRKLHRIAEARLHALKLQEAAASAARSPILGLDGARLVATPEEARRARR